VVTLFTAPATATDDSHRRGGRTTLSRAALADTTQYQVRLDHSSVTSVLHHQRSSHGRVRMKMQQVPPAHNVYTLIEQCHFHATNIPQ
jgi:hypothetical protein